MIISNDKWLVSAQKPVNPTMHLVCFPYGGGGASVYREWGKSLPAHVQLWSVQYPGRENRFTDSFAASYQNVVSGVLKDMQSLGLTNVVLFGHSMGAQFATMLASEVFNADANVQRQVNLKGLIVSGIKPPHLVNDKLWSKVSEQELKDHVLNLGAMPEEVKNDQDFLSMYMEKIRADYALYESVPVVAPERFEIPLLAIRGESDPLFSANDFSGWQEWSTKPVTFEVFAGSHFYFNPYPSPLLRTISQHLRSL